MDNEQTFKMLIISALFLAWFFASVFEMYYAWKNRYICVQKIMSILVFTGGK